MLQAEHFASVNQKPRRVRKPQIPPRMVRTKIKIVDIFIP